MNTGKTKSAKQLLLRGAIAILSFVLLLNLSTSNVVSVTGDIPQTMEKGSTVPITITINKGNTDGFGRFSCELPEGFSATSDDPNFILSKNTITFLWIKLPQAQSFTVSYNIIIPEDAPNSFTFAAKFGYIENNEKRFAELAPVNVKLGEDVVTPAVIAAVEETTTTPAPTEAADVATATETTATPAASQAINYDKIGCERSVSFNGNEATVTINVNKDNASLCKIEDMLPTGYSINVIDNGNSKVSTVQNVARFMWTDASAVQSETVSYKVTADKGYDIKDLFISGAFSVYDNGETKSYVIADTESGISESTGKLSAKQTTEKTQIDVASNASNYYSSAEVRQDLKKSKLSDNEAEFFANTNAINTLHTPSKSEVTAFEEDLAIPEPTIAAASDKEEAIAKEEARATKEQATKTSVDNSAATTIAASDAKTTQASDASNVTTAPKDFAAQESKSTTTVAVTEPVSNYEISQTKETTTTKEVVSKTETPNLISNILNPSSAKPIMTSIEAEQPTQITQTTTETKTQVTTTTTTITPTRAATTNTSASSMLASSQSKPNTVTRTATKPATTASSGKKTVAMSNKNSLSQQETRVSKTNANNSVSYRVQIAAAHRQIKNSKSFFAARNIKDPITTERIDNWYKYTINSYDTYVKARNQRNLVWENTPIKKAFVVAYNGKKRITVMEALTLTNQKWVK